MTSAEHHREYCPQPGDFYLYKCVYVVLVEGMGGGLFSGEKKDIQKDEKILSFCGQYKSPEEATEYALQVGNIFLETSPNTQYENYINHSCQPNCHIEFHLDLPDGSSEEELIGTDSKPGQVVLVADKVIHPDEQFFFDYATTEINMGAEMVEGVEGQNCAFVCQCGAENCRGLILGAVGLTLDQAKEFWKRGHLSPHVKRFLLQKFGRQVEG